MLTIKDTNISLMRTRCALALLFVLGLTASVSGQNTPVTPDVTKGPGQKAAAPLRQPIASVYKEVKIGTAADEVRELLGKAKIDDKDGFFYEMEPEIVQIRLDKNAKVRLISVTYPSKSQNAPAYSDIFGEEPVNPKPDGSVYRLVRYPAAGYWVAYSKTGGAEPVITVTMQKIR